MQTLNKTISHYQQGSEFSATDRAVNLTLDQSTIKGLLGGLFLIYYPIEKGKGGRGSVW